MIIARLGLLSLLVSSDLVIAANTNEYQAIESPYVTRRLRVEGSSRTRRSERGRFRKENRASHRECIFSLYRSEF